MDALQLLQHAGDMVVLKISKQLRNKHREWHTDRQTLTQLGLQVCTCVCTCVCTLYNDPGNDLSSLRVQR